MQNKSLPNIDTVFPIQIPKERPTCSPLWGQLAFVKLRTGTAHLYEAPGAGVDSSRANLILEQFGDFTSR